MKTDELGAELLGAVARLHRWATRHTQLSVSLGLARLLAQIEELGPTRIGELARADNSSQPTMTTQVQRLERLGLVTKQADPTDARAVLITVTPAGRSRLTEMRESRAATVAPLLAGLTAAEREHLRLAVRALDRILSAASRT